MSKAEEGYAPLMSAKLAKERGQVLKQGLVGFAMIIVAVWSLLSIYWGSLYQIEKFFPRIAVDVYDLDQGGLLGPAVTRTLSQISQTPSKPHFTYRIVDNVTGVTLQDIEQRTVDERSWLAVVINANASSAFESAVAGTGGLVNGQYMPEGAISIVYANGRFFQVVVTYLTPQAQLDLEMPLLEAGMAATSQALQQFDTPSQYAALSESQRQALAYPFSYQNIDVRPIKNNQWASAAPLEAGLIYYIIFAFVRPLVLPRESRNVADFTCTACHALFVFYAGSDRGAASKERHAHLAHERNSRPLGAPCALLFLPVALVLASQRGVPSADEWQRALRSQLAVWLHG